MSPRYDLAQLLDTETDPHRRLIRRTLPRFSVVSIPLERFTFVEVQFSYFSAMGATLNCGRIVRSLFEESDFNSCVVEDCYFKEVVFHNVSFRNSTLRSCCFDKCSWKFLSPVTTEDKLRFENCIFIDFDPMSEEGNAFQAVEFVGCVFVEGKSPFKTSDTGENVQLKQGTSVAVEKRAEPMPKKAPSEPQAKEETQKQAAKGQENPSTSRFDTLEFP